jgi:hypothetical protein
MAPLKLGSRKSAVKVTGADRRYRRDAAHDQEWPFGEAADERRASRHGR